MFDDPWVRRSPGEGHENPLQYSCLENSMDRGAWRAAVHGVAKESDRPSDGAHTDHTQHSSIMFFIPHFFFSRPLLRACADRNLVPKGTVSTNTLTARHGNEGSIFLASLGDFQINLFLSFLETSILESPVIQAFSLLNNCTPPRNGQRTCENVSECSFPGGKKKRQAFPMRDV